MNSVTSKMQSSEIISFLTSEDTVKIIPSPSRVIIIFHSAESKLFSVICHAQKNSGNVHLQL